jgi:uncharacterized protein YcgI (DUF1989 family)
MRVVGTTCNDRHVVERTDVSQQDPFDVHPVGQDTRTDAARRIGTPGRANPTELVQAADGGRARRPAMALQIVAARSGVGLVLRRGQTLRVVDPDGGQSGDIVAFRLGDTTEWLCNGRSFDYGGKLYFGAGDTLYSNRSAPMLTITADDVGCHDFLYSPCSQEMFRIQYGVTGAHPNCLENLSRALADHGVAPHQVPTAFNVFMNAKVQSDGRLVIGPPVTKPGDATWFRAEMDLAVALTSCPVPLAGGGSGKPLAYEILDA